MLASSPGGPEAKPGGSGYVRPQHSGLQTASPFHWARTQGPLLGCPSPSSPFKPGSLSGVRLLIPLCTEGRWQRAGGGSSGHPWEPQLDSCVGRWTESRWLGQHHAMGAAVHLLSVSEAHPKQGRWREVALWAPNTVLRLLSRAAVCAPKCGVGVTQCSGRARDPGGEWPEGLPGPLGRDSEPRLWWVSGTA